MYVCMCGVYVCVHYIMHVCMCDVYVCMCCVYKCVYICVSIYVIMYICIVCLWCVCVCVREREREREREKGLGRCLYSRLLLTCHFTNFLIPVIFTSILLVNFKNGEELISKTLIAWTIFQLLEAFPPPKKNIRQLLYLSG